MAEDPSGAVAPNEIDAAFNRATVIGGAALGGALVLTAAVLAFLSRQGGGAPATLGLLRIIFFGVVAVDAAAAAFLRFRYAAIGLAERLITRTAWLNFLFATTIILWMAPLTPGILGLVLWYFRRVSGQTGTPTDVMAFLGIAALWSFVFVPSRETWSDWLRQAAEIRLDRL